ncbi:type II toxin-antitoxin system VapC family toxin [Candidatus Peregrinibacteria bacterium]|nr:type II toxin-antitoxin system VapC family toxin [Candidatus Peregrinibacteria bacterium]
MVANRKNLILDTSVILKWIFKEDNYESARKIGNRLIDRKITITVPSHFFAEIANVLGRKEGEKAMEFISALRMSTIRERFLSLSVINLALELMRKYKKITFYDAAYHAIAILENGTFVTADEDYYKITNKEGRITLLKDYA